MPAILNPGDAFRTAFIGRPRWCIPCQRQVSTQGGCYLPHYGPDQKPCPNGGERVPKYEQLPLPAVQPDPSIDR